MKRFAAAFGLLAALLVPSTAFAEDATVNTVNILSTPDDGNPPWARDTFVRKTSITDTGEGHLVTIVDEGTFKTGDVTGDFSGKAQWEVAGELKADIPATSEPIDRSGAETKGDFTSAWWKQFFADGATSTGIADWEWTYSRCDGDAKVSRTENEQGVSGASYEDLAEAVCPSASPSATASPSASASPGASSSPAASNTTNPAATDQPTLPLTGSGTSTLVGIGVAVLVAGAITLLVFRLRRHRFEA